MPVKKPEKTVVYVSKPEHVPQQRHWALLKGTSKSDGYDGTTPCVDYVAYLDKEEMLEEVRKNTMGYYHTPIAVLEVIPLTIKIDVQVEAEPASS